MRFSPDGSHLLVGSFRDVRVVNVTTGRTELHIEGETSRENEPAFYQRAGRVRTLAVQPGNENIACAGDNGIVWLANPVLSTWTAVGEQSGPVVSIAFLPDGRLAAGSTDGTVKIWRGSPS